MADAPNERTLSVPITYARPADATKVSFDTISIAVNLGRGTIGSLEFGPGGGQKLDGTGRIVPCSGAQADAFFAAVKAALVAGGLVP